MSAESKSARDSRSALALLRRFWSFARPYRAWVFFGMAAIPVVVATVTIRPLLIKLIVDDYLPSGDLDGITTVVTGFFVLILLEFLGFGVQVYALQRAGHATIADLRTQIFRHALRLPAKFFDKHPIGGLLSRATSDVEALSETLSFGVFTILTDAVIITAILVAMFSLDAKLALISLSVGPVLILLVRYFSRALRGLQLEIRRAQGVQSGYLTEQLTGISVIQLHGRQAASHESYGSFGRRYLRATKLTNIYDAFLFSVMEGIAWFCVALLLYFAAPDSLKGGLTFGLLAAFVDYLQRIFVPIRDFSGKLATIQRAAASLERVYDFLDEPAESRSERGQNNGLEDWRGAVKVRDLHFAYGPDAPDVLKGVSFDVAPGEVVAVVGRTGSGKTSLGRVLTRFYSGYRGQVALVQNDGRQLELSELAPDHLRRELLMVQQDVFLFDADARFNVSLGQPDVDVETTVERALETVQASEFINERGGLSLQVGERGRNLSVGEAQLLAFARVAARSPQMLILDEATASVDSMTEQRVQAAIEKLLKGRSVLVIAHRLSTVRHADKILVMHEGRIAESGRHEELMARNGLYAELYRSGFEDAAQDDEAVVERE